MNWIILDFGTYEIKALKAKIDPTRLEILEFTKFPSRPDYFKGLASPQEPAWASITISLNEIDWLKPEEECLVTAALPSAYLETRYIRFPFKNEKQIEKVLNFELEAQLPFDIDDILVRHRILEGEGVETLKKEALVLTFSYKREHVKAFEAELRKFQMNPPPVSAEILGLSSLRQAILSDPVFGLLDLGHSKAQFLLMQRSGNILACRTFWWGGEKVIQTIASDHNLDFAKAESAFLNLATDTDSIGIVSSVDKAILPFIQEFRQTLKSFHSNGIRLPDPLPVYGFGGLSQVPGILDKIDAGLSNDVKVSTRKFPIESLFSKNILGRQNIPDEAHALTVISIALSQLRNHRARIPVFSETGFQIQQNLKKFKTSSFSLLKKVAMLLIAPFLYSVLQFVIQEKESKVVVTKLNEMLKRSGFDAKGETSTENILKKMKAERAQNRSKLDQVREDDSSPLVVLTQVSRAIPNNVKIDVKEFKVTDSIISISAETTSAEAAQIISTALQSQYPKAKMGGLSACSSGKSDCKLFTIEASREDQK